MVRGTSDLAEDRGSAGSEFRGQSLGLGGASVEILTGTQAIPERLAAAGYKFRFPALAEALAAELATR